MTSDDVRLRQEAGHFVRWALAQKIARDLSFPAGLLLLLYAQWPAAISRLTVDHIEETDGPAPAPLGARPAGLPAPAAELALQQVEVRRSHAVLGLTASS